MRSGSWCRCLEPTSSAKQTGLTGERGLTPQNIPGIFSVSYATCAVPTARWRRTPPAPNRSGEPCHAIPSKPFDWCHTDWLPSTSSEALVKISDGLAMIHGSLSRKFSKMAVQSPYQRGDGQRSGLNPAHRFKPSVICGHVCAMSMSSPCFLAMAIHAEIPRPCQKGSCPQCDKDPEFTAPRVQKRVHSNGLLNEYTSSIAAVDCLNLPVRFSSEIFERSVLRLSGVPIPLYHIANMQPERSPPVLLGRLNMSYFKG